MADQRETAPAAPSSTTPGQAKRYSAVEKWEACELARRTTISQAAKELGITYASISAWLDRYPAGSRRPEPVE